MKNNQLECAAIQQQNKTAQCRICNEQKLKKKTEKYLNTNKRAVIKENEK